MNFRVLRTKDLAEEDKKFVLSVEKKVYPEEMLSLSKISEGNLDIYLEEEKPYFILSDSGYLIYTYNEIIDFAFLKPLSLSDINKLHLLIRPGIYSAELRHSTSYRICKYLYKKKKINMTEEEIILRCGEKFHKVKLCFFLRKS